MIAQLELFAPADTLTEGPPPPPNCAHWFKQLRQWPAEVFNWRHATNTTGWSVATAGLSFAIMLHRAGNLDTEEFRRYCKFNRRVRAWDRRGDAKERVARAAYELHAAKVKAAREKADRASRRAARASTR
jgi:hypothetical protein